MAIDNNHLCASFSWKKFLASCIIFATQMGQLKIDDPYSESAVNWIFILGIYWRTKLVTLKHAQSSKNMDHKEHGNNLFKAEFESQCGDEWLNNTESQILLRTNTFMVTYILISLFPSMIILKETGHA